jgi:hypothetical protein
MKRMNLKNENSNTELLPKCFEPYLKRIKFNFKNLFL